MSSSMPSSAVVRCDITHEWARFEILAARTWPGPDAARELLRARLRNPRYDSLQLGASGAATRQLEDTFLAAFAAAAQAGRCHVRGFRRGDLAATDIPAALITVEALKGIKGEEWQVGGDTWHGVSVDAVTELAPPSPTPPKLEDASDEEIDAKLTAIYAGCEKTGRKPPNLKEIDKPVQESLRVEGRYATLERIRDLAHNPKYVRGRPGPRPRRKPAGTAPEQL
jgi:hypothetical protein